MPRIRTLKPSFWADGDVGKLNFEARLCLIALISLADDDGRFIATPAAIIGYAYPFDQLNHGRVKGWLEKIGKTGIVEFYTRDGQEFGHFPHWAQHQRINRPTPSGLPPPPIEIH